MIFGYGKVGRGISSALRSAGTPAENITIIDVSFDAFMRAKEDGYQAMSLDVGGSKAKLDEAIETIKKELLSTDNIITATGVKDAISTYFGPEDLKSSTLINMGTPDEYGHKFSATSIINDKKPANFLLPYPTKVMYLDPIFTLYLKAAENILTGELKVNGIRHVSANTYRDVLKDWMNIHGNNIWCYQTVTSEIEDLISKVKTAVYGAPEALNVLLANYGIFKIEQQLSITSSSNGLYQSPTDNSLHQSPTKSC